MNDVKYLRSNNFKEKLDRIGEIERVKEEIIRDIFDELRNKDERFLAVSAKMGGGRSYISSVSLGWFADVRFASDLEIFRKYRNDEGKSVAINRETLDFISQRKPDWSRQEAITNYMATKPHHKFPPVLLVAYQNWIFDEKSEHGKWGRDRRAIEDSVTVKPLDSKGWIVDFDHSETDFYALDGQHRLMAVKGLRDLLDGNLRNKKKDGAVGSRLINIEKVLRDALKNEPGGDLESIRSRLFSIMDEKIGVEIIPAVRAGETLEEAFKRLRQIFVDVNKNAKRLTPGELALLEAKGFSTVAREVMVSHPLFRYGEIVDEKNATLNKRDDKNYTTLQAIVKMAEFYLGQLNIFGNKDSSHPTEEELKEGVKKLSAYFDAMRTLPSHARMAEGESISMLRRRDEDGEDNVLFRPITQMALAQAVGDLEKNRSSLTPEIIMERLGKKDDPEKPDLKLTDTESLFFGVLCDINGQNMRRGQKDRRLAAEIFKYLLGGIEDDEQEELREKIFECRRITPDGSEEHLAINYYRDRVLYKDFDLPRPWY